MSIFGYPNAGKTVLRNALAERHPGMASCCIDDFRKKHGDGTSAGEFLAQREFLDTMDKEDGFYESSGAGMVAQDALEFLTAELSHLLDPCISELLRIMGSRPVSSADLMRKMGLKDRVNFQTRYLRPAVEHGFVELTDPAGCASPAEP